MGEGKPLARVPLGGRTPWGRRGTLLAKQGGAKQGIQPSKFPGWRLCHQAPGLTPKPMWNFLLLKISFQNQMQGVPLHTSPPLITCLVAKLGAGLSSGNAPHLEAGGCLQARWREGGTGSSVGCGVQLLGEAVGESAAPCPCVRCEPAVPAPRSSRAPAPLRCEGRPLLKCSSAVRSYVFGIEAGRCPEAPAVVRTVVLSWGNGPRPRTPWQRLETESLVTSELGGRVTAAVAGGDRSALRHPTMQGGPSTVTDVPRCVCVCVCWAGKG